MLHADHDLARRLEAAEATLSRNFAEALTRLRPDRDVVILPAAGGWVLFAGPGSPMTEAKGMAMDGPITDDDLDRLDALYRGRGVRARVSACPLADASLWEGLGRRGYRPIEFETVLYRTLAEDDPPTTGIDPAIEVRPARPEESERYLQAVFPNFLPEGLTEEARELSEVMFGSEGMYPFLALVDGRDAGGGALLVHEGVALLAGAATLPAFRRRGVQAAVQAARIDLARRLGCNLLTQMAQPGGSSQRNAERRGMRVAYTKVILARDPDLGASPTPP